MDADQRSADPAALPFRLFVIRLLQYWNLVRPFRWRLLSAALLTMALTALQTAPPLVMRYIVNEVATPGGWGLLGPAVIAVAAIPILNALGSMVNRLQIAAVGQRLVVDLRTALYSHVLQLSMRYHGRVGAGPLMSRLMTDVGIVQTMVTGETMATLSSVVALAVYIYMAFTIHVPLAAIMVLSVVICAWNYRRFGRLIRSANLEVREIMDEVTGHAHERIAGVRLVKTYCRERDEVATFLASTDRALQSGLNAQMLSVGLTTSARLIAGIGSTVIWCMMAYLILTGTDGMRFGDLIAMNAFFWQALNPAISLTTVADQLVQAVASLDRITEVTHEPIDIVERPGARDLPPSPEGDLRLEGVTFRYVENTPLFENLTLHLPAGKMTALVGHTGCGKTTVTALLMRLWDVQGGRVTMDGADVRDLTLRSLREQMGVVLQDPVIFEGTVTANIAYAEPDATPAEVEEAARAAQIHDVIAALPAGYDSWLGKGGVQLSVGQKQRIAIARAAIRKPAVLIMDEATSSLDSESEAAIQQALHTVLHGRTSVVVAHRLSTIVEADQIVAMRDGRVVEVGTHAELMQVEGGYYRALYDELSSGGGAT